MDQNYGTCLLLAALLLALLCRRVFRSLARPPIRNANTAPELYASSLPCTRAALDPNDRGQLMDAVRAMRTHAAEDQLLDAGALLQLLRRAIAAAPGSRAAAAATAALKEEVRPGMDAAELARRHAECDETLRLLRRDAAEGGGDWQRLSQHGGTSTFVRRGADGTLWARAAGEVGGSGAAPPVSQLPTPRPMPLGAAVRAARRGCIVGATAWVHAAASASRFITPARTIPAMISPGAALPRARTLPALRALQLLVRPCPVPSAAHL